MQFGTKVSHLHNSCSISLNLRPMNSSLNFWITIQSYQTKLLGFTQFVFQRCIETSTMNSTRNGSQCISKKQGSLLKGICVFQRTLSGLGRSLLLIERTKRLILMKKSLIMRTITKWLNSKRGIFKNKRKESSCLITLPSQNQATILQSIFSNVRD